MMLPKKDNSVFSFALLLALASAATPVVQSFLSAKSVLAQSPTPSFTLPPVVPKDQKVKVDGSTSLQTINQTLKQKYAAKYPGTVVDFSYNGTPAALQAVLDGKADIAAIGRPLTEAEQAKGLKQIVVARHKIAMIVSPDNPFKGSLEDKQFARIFRGEITDWSQVGGTPGAIRFIDRPEISDTRQAFRNYPVFKSAPFQVGAGAIKLDEDSTEAILKQLGTDGISYAIADQVLNQPGVRVVPMHKTMPDDPRYPFSQPLVYVYRGTPPVAVQAFLAAAVAPENQQAIEAARTAGAIAQIAPSPEATPSPEAIASPSPAASPSAVPAAPVAEPTKAAIGDISPWWLLLPAGIIGLAWFLQRPKAGGVPPVASPDVVPPTAQPAVPPPDAVPPATPVPGGTPPTAEVIPPVADVPPAPSPAGTGIPAGLAGAAAVGAGAAAIAGIAGATANARSRITLTPRGSHQAYAIWDAPEAHKSEVQAQGGENLMLRLYDVTGLDPETQTPNSTEEFDVEDWSTDRNLPIPEYERDYVAEVGYLSGDDRWLPMARSNSIRVSPPKYSEEEVTIEGTKIDPTYAGAALAAGAGAVAMAALAKDDQSNVEAAKFDVGQTDLSSEDLASVDKGLPDLPDGYGESRIVLMPRDPQWGYTYWDTPDEHKQEVRRQGGQKLALRIYDVTDVDLSYQAPHNLQQYDCDEMARDWYVPIPVSDRDYIAEIGYLTADGRWLMLARSAPCRIPPVFPSDWYEDYFATIEWEEDLRGKTFATLIPPSRKLETGNPIYDQIFGMAESAEAMRVAGSLFGSMQHVPGSVFGSMQMVSESALSSFVFPSGVGMGFAPGVGVPGVPTFSGLTMSGIGMSGVGFSASMPPIRARKFWLVADAELIIYGATEPDATVTIAGRPIQLNPDGTFRFQMSFQDGLLDFPIMAVAADGEQNRAIHMKFTRETPLRHTNTKDEAKEEEF